MGTCLRPLAEISSMSSETSSEYAEKELLHWGRQWLIRPIYWYGSSLIPAYTFRGRSLCSRKIKHILNIHAIWREGLTAYWARISVKMILICSIILGPSGHFCWCVKAHIDINILKTHNINMMTLNSRLVFASSCVAKHWPLFPVCRSIFGHPLQITVG